jgi:hypothetical protein
MFLPFLSNVSRNAKSDISAKKRMFSTSAFDKINVERHTFNVVFG